MCKSCRRLACDKRCQIKVLLIQRPVGPRGRQGAGPESGHGQPRDRPQPRRGRSPEQIEGRLKLLGEETVDREWIYRKAGDGCMRLQDLHRALQCRTASLMMPESRDCRRF
ncbi:MAG: hypothetical protein OXF73_00025, partial [Gammaproteobacteria bacterium]|nr:hypothetical protein [Gammaproteobacteria bacterium]